MGKHLRHWTPERSDEWLYEHIEPEPNSGCWLWAMALKPNGYGHCDFKGRAYPAHRIVYQLFKGAVPKGMDLDHLCRVRSCVRPSHLEPVTRSENLRRGDGGKVLAAYTKTAQRNAKGWNI